MRLAVISDIHGNKTALDAALKDLDAQGDVDEIWCLGDLAAFGPHPAACIRRIQDLQAKHGEKKFKVIGGNTDRYLVTGERFPAKPAKDAETLEKMRRNWRIIDDILVWNVEQLSFEDYQFLASILGKELSTKADGFGWVIGYHAVPGDDEAFLTVETPEEQVLDYLLDREGRLAIGGHTHVQMDRTVGNWRVVNAGSVGLARKAYGQAQWALITIEGDTAQIDLRSAEFDINAAVAEVITSGHPAPEFVIRQLRPE